MDKPYYISMFHHRHGVSAAVINGEATAYWKAADGHDPLNAEEYITDAPLPPVFAGAPELLATCHALLAIVEQEYADDPEPGELRSWRRVIKQATEAIAKAEGRTSEQDRPVD